LIDSAEFRVQFQTDVVNRLSTLGPNECIFLQDDLSRNTINGISQSLDGRVDMALFSEDKDHDQVDFSFLLKFFVKGNEILVLRKF
jgi:hypothetical protein